MARPGPRQRSQTWRGYSLVGRRGQEGVHWGVGTRPAERRAEEERLIRAAQKGDRPAFAALVEVYWDRLYRWLYHLAHDRHTAEDLTQETFLKAFAGLHGFRAGTNF